MSPSDDAEAAALRAEIEALQQRFEELELLHETVVEHGTALENELEQKNRRIEEVLVRLRRYLSPQLYQIVTDRSGEPSLSHRRRRLTVFFSSLVGFANVIDTVEPETLADCLNHYLDRMSKIAISHGATIDKFIGESIMIFFGDPVFESDQAHALRCVRMALEMSEAVAGVNRYWKRAGVSTEILMRAGINTGYCTVGDFGTGERMAYTAVGAQVLIAVRLERLAVPGTIVVSEATKVLVESEIETAYLGAIHGVHGPVKTFELRGPKEPEEHGRYLSLGADAVTLKDVSFSPETLDDGAREEMAAALRTVLRLLEGSRGGAS
jgi:adenylate cyclase